MTTVAKNTGRESATYKLPLAYPFRWEGLEAFTYPVDQTGVPLVAMGPEVGLRYNPVTIAQFGLFNLQQFSSTAESRFLACARLCVSWLLDNFRPWRDGIGAWVYDFDLDFYGPKAPWISGMAQGQGISLLLRFCQIEQVDNIREITRQAFQAFLHPVTQGGVAAAFQDGSLVFEEFTTQVPSRVLNGHLFALLGIHDYACFWQEKAAKELFEVASSGLANNLSRYDTGYWNLYDLHPTRRLASPMYLKVHVQLLTILAELTGQSAFSETAEKWRGYGRNPFCRARWLFAKMVEKMRLLVPHAAN
ncbi:MAG: D-glucuronyl C5-epimerase family protein [bacterium]